jgi:hypothetical protein
MPEFETWLLNRSFNRVIRVIQNHHTFIPNYGHFKKNGYEKLLKGMEASHLERGFAEIAQNITTFPDGTIAICRSIEKIPAGIKGANANGICIEHVGNFDQGGDEMTPEHKDTIVRLNALLCRKFNLPVNTSSIIYHHWYDLNTGKRTDGSGSTKTCPGTNFFGGNTVAACEANFIPLINAASQATALPGTVVIDNVNLQHAIVKVSLLNVRNGAGVNNSVIKRLQQGTQVAIYNQVSGWYKISTDNHWVKSEFVELEA